MQRPLLPDCKPKIIRVTERIEDDKLVLYRGHKLFVMGVFAAEIWHTCDGEHSVEDMAEMVVTKYNIPKEKALEDICEFLTRLAERNLIMLQGS